MNENGFAKLFLSFSPNPIGKKNLSELVFNSDIL